MLVAAERRLNLPAPIGDLPSTRWGEEICLTAHRALDDVVMHAIRLAVIAEAGIRAKGDDGMARQYHQTMTDRARALLARWRRPAKELDPAGY